MNETNHIDQAGIHPAPSEFSKAQVATDPILHFFHYAHLPEKLRATSRLFFILASELITNLPRNAERTVALRKLLEAKDAAVRANLVAPTADERDLEEWKQAKRGIVGTGVGTLCGHPMIYAGFTDRSIGKCTSCEQQVSTNGYVQSAARAQGFLTRLPDTREFGEPREIGGHDQYRDGDPEFSG